MALPPEINASLDVYTKAFEAVKGNRTLVWKNHLGFANIDLELGGTKLNLTVSPVHAAIIYQFQDKEDWPAEELAHALKIPVSTLRRKIGFWLTQGLVKELPGDRYALVEDGQMRRRPSGAGGAHGGANASHVGMDDEDDADGGGVTQTSQDQLDEELQVFWSYIYNMLVNLESLPLERIYQMLKMFAMQGPNSSGAEVDVDQVRNFLDKKVRERELLFSGGQYRLPKN